MWKFALAVVGLFTACGLALCWAIDRIIDKLDFDFSDWDQLP